MNVIESMEIERMDVISIAFNKIISCIEIMGERSNVTSSKLKNVKFSIEQDLHELIVSYGDSSQQPHEIQIYDIPAEDFKIQISRSLREEMLARWISRMDVLIQHCGKSLRGIENLTKFCKENTKFAIPSGDAQTTRISQSKREIEADPIDIQSPHLTRIFTLSNVSVSDQLEQRPQKTPKVAALNLLLILLRNIHYTLHVQNGLDFLPYNEGIRYAGGLHNSDPKYFGMEHVSDCAVPCHTFLVILILLRIQ
ncbi:hypothetical protein GJ496_010518 [Pomphorhynchus laevis]|nr:hypothetical protein GJ496_010518 [Pomphorhynchus laevis]